MHNFYLNFSSEWIGDVYRKQKPYLAATHVDGFNELAKDIRENLNQVRNPTLAVYIFTKDYKQVHLDLYKAYLIMREFVEEKDLEMFR